MKIFQKRKETYYEDFRVNLAKNVSVEFCFVRIGKHIENGFMFCVTPCAMIAVKNRKYGARFALFLDFVFFGFGFHWWYPDDYNTDCV